MIILFWIVNFDKTLWSWSSKFCNYSWCMHFHVLTVKSLKKLLKLYKIMIIRKKIALWDKKSRNVENFEKHNNKFPKSTSGKKIQWKFSFFWKKQIVLPLKKRKFRVKSLWRNFFQRQTTLSLGLDEKKNSEYIDTTFVCHIICIIC